MRHTSRETENMRTLHRKYSAPETLSKSASKYYLKGERQNVSLFNCRVGTKRKTISNISAGTMHCSRVYITIKVIINKQQLILQAMLAR